MVCSLPVTVHPTARSLFRLAALISFFFAFCDQKSHAETIWIESETHFVHETDVNSDDGGRIKATLLDDLNAPVAGMPVQIRLKSRHSGREYAWDVQTDASGNVARAMHLVPDGYDGSIAFQGTEIYRPARAAVSFDIAQCVLETRTYPEFPVYVPVGEAVSFELRRDTCRGYRANYMVSAGAFSRKVTLGRGESSARIDFNLHRAEPGRVEVEIAPSGAYLDANVRRGQVVFYDALFSELTVHRAKRLVATLAENIDTIQAVAELTDAEGNRVVLPSKPDTHGSAEFDLPAELDGCYRVRIARADAWPEKGVFERELCFEPRRSPAVHAVLGLAFLAVILLCLHRFRGRKRPKLPAMPQKRATVTAVSRRQGPAKDGATLTCVDMKTGTPLPPAETTVQQGSDVMHPESWPLSLKNADTVSILHPNYLIWQGKIHSDSDNTVALQARRDYVIACFEAVCEAYHLDGWGRETPSRLAEMIGSDSASAFCERVSRVAFDVYVPSDEELQEIRANAKKLMRRA